MTVSAGIGIGNFTFDDAQGFWQWVDLCEAGGVDSIWQSDRLIGSQPNLECMSVMAALAGRTRRIKFGTNVASLGLRDPVITAKQCATIDVLSEGRLLPAFGIGSSLSRDYVATGKPTRGRGKRMDEGLEILTRLWTEDAVTFKGTYYQLSAATINPKPVQHPLPLWVGGSAKQAIERTARWGTGWQAGISAPHEVALVIEAIQSRARELGRTIDQDHYGAGFSFRFAQPDEPLVERFLRPLIQRLGRNNVDDYVAIGGVEEIIALLLRFRRAGVHKFVLRPLAEGTSDMLSQTKQLIEKVLPEVTALNA